MTQSVFIVAESSYTSSTYCCSPPGPVTSNVLGVVPAPAQGYASSRTVGVMPRASSAVVIDVSLYGVPASGVGGGVGDGVAVSAPGDGGAPAG
jgi:hypothetical protein